VSISLVVKEIDRFLTTPEAEVLCIRGKWGVGKSYTWNSLVRTAGREGRIALKSYSYVSLFSLESIEQVKYAIFENLVASKDVGIEPNVESFKSNTDAVAKLVGKRWLSPLFQLSPGKGYGAAFQALSFLWIREQIICFDDLERTGANLRVKDVLGLASQLRDQKACKVVLILNDDALGDDENDFKLYNEKVIDVSFEFAPDASDCARIALTEEGRHFDLLRDAVVALDISNIRVIKKIERFVRRLAPLVAQLEPGVLEQTVKSLTLLTWSVHGEDAPSAAFVRDKRGHRFYGDKDEDQETADEKKWHTLIDDLGFTHMDDFDQLLLEGIERGFFDDETLLAEAAKLNEQFAAAKAHGSLKEAWSLYHGTFADNEAKLTEKIIKSFHENVRFVTPFDLNGVVSLLKDLNHPEDAVAAIEYFIEHRSDSDPSLFDLSQHPFGEDVTDPDIRTAFEGICKTITDDRSPADILLSISKNRSWGSSDIARLAELSVDDFYALFKSESDNLSRIVQASLQFSKIGGVDDTEMQISVNATEALKRIGDENRLNKRRVERKYGIILDGPP
jgi:hypothetical protein